MQSTAGAPPDIGARRVGEDAFFRMSGMGTGAPGMTDRTPAALAVPVNLFEVYKVLEG